MMTTSTLYPKNQSREIARLSKSIHKMCHKRSLSLDEIFKSSNSTLGKLYELFLSLRDNKDHLLHQKIFDELIWKTTKDLLLIKPNPTNNNSISFIQFIKQIQQIAKENQLSKDYLYEKILRQKLYVNTQNQNNNAFISDDHLLNEYKEDLSRLKEYFIIHSGKSNEMSCSTFIKCIYQKTKLNKLDHHFDLNGLFYQIQSLFVNEQIYIPGCLTIDFHGFLLCLQEISRIFHLNLRILIKTLLNKNSN